MRILLTGVSGQVGSALLPRLKDFAEVIAADRKLLDLTAPEAIPGVLDRVRPDLIVNPAAYTAVDRAEDEPDLAFQVNALAPGALAQWAARAGVGLVHFSTDYVFDGSGDKPWTEDDQPHPLSTYGTSKLAGETAIRAAGGAHLILRTSWVYAAKGANFLRTMARLAIEREELRVVADQIGAPTSAQLIADAVWQILAPCLGVSARVDASKDALAERFTAGSGLVHLVAAGETSWHGFAEAIVAGLAVRDVPLKAQRVLPIATADYPTKARRPANSRLDTTRLRKRLAITPERWQVALERELDLLAAELKAS